MALYQCYTWTYQLRVPPYDKLLALLEAFFASYPQGDYACEHRETYKLEFRRGQWKRLLGLGPMVPARLPAEQFEQWPVRLRVLARPSPEAFLITVRYELHLPRSVRQLPPEVQSSFDQHARRELAALADYLAECIRLPEPPNVEIM